MTDTVTAAIAKRDTGPGAMIQQYAADFRQVLPSHIKGDAWVRLATGVLRRDRAVAQIANRNPASLMQALLECARLGHEPGTEAFYLVPMGGEIEGWEGYRGVIQRMYRAGAVVSVKAEIVKANDHFHYQPHMSHPEHEVEWFSDRGPIRGAYAYAEMRDGSTSKVVVLDQHYLAKVRAMSKGSDKPTSPWQKWEEAMVLKTAVHRLEPFVPTSVEWLEAHIRGSQEGPATEKPTDVSHLPEVPAPPAAPDVVEAELVDDEAAWAEDATRGD